MNKTNPDRDWDWYYPPQGSVKLLKGVPMHLVGEEFQELSNEAIEAREDLEYVDGVLYQHEWCTRQQKNDWYQVPMDGKPGAQNDRAAKRLADARSFAESLPNNGDYL